MNPAIVAHVEIVATVGVSQLGQLVTVLQPTIPESRSVALTREVQVVASLCGRPPIEHRTRGGAIVRAGRADLVGQLGRDVVGTVPRVSKRSRLNIGVVAVVETSP